jgi:hypothetical protein
VSLHHRLGLYIINLFFYCNRYFILSRWNRQHRDTSRIYKVPKKNFMFILSQTFSFQCLRVLRPRLEFEEEAQRRLRRQNTSAGCSSLALPSLARTIEHSKIRSPFLQETPKIWNEKKKRKQSGERSQLGDGLDRASRRKYPRSMAMEPRNDSSDKCRIGFH